MKINSHIVFLLTILWILTGSCTKTKNPAIKNTPESTDSSSTLKDASAIKIGVGITLSDLTSGSVFLSTVQKEFDAITVGYEMKHGALVKADGSVNFTNADAILNLVGSMDVFGHVLGWHSNQNAHYLKNFAGITVPAAVELLTNPGFESGQTGWAIFNSNGAAITFVTGTASNAHIGSGFMQVVNTAANPGAQWKVQVAGNEFATIPGKQYLVSFWVKAAARDGSIRLSTQTANGGSAQYQNDQNIGTNWQQVSWTLVANSTQTRILFDMGLVANTYSIDDVSVKEIIQAPTSAQVVEKADQALSNWIHAEINHFKNKVREWDVVNEVIAPSGQYRTSSTSTDIANKEAADIFFWSDYLGRDYPLKAFQYAKAADPTAKLFINEFGLEASAKKTDSLVAFVKELRAKGAKIDGIGTQLHASWNSNYTLIDSMFIKLAATGLLIRISELDVRVNPQNKAGFQFTSVEELNQAAMYKHILKSYLKYVPKSQQAGITIWGLTDDRSWLYNNGMDFPLLFHSNFSKKKAYSAVIQALKEL